MFLFLEISLAVIRGPELLLENLTLQWSQSNHATPFLEIDKNVSTRPEISYGQIECEFMYQLLTQSIWM